MFGKSKFMMYTNSICEVILFYFFFKVIWNKFKLQIQFKITFTIVNLYIHIKITEIKTQ